MKGMILKSLTFLIMMLSGSVVFSQITVTGVVSDSGGPIPGVNVVVKGTTNGASTDFDGRYTINNVPSGGTLVFSYLGFVTREVPVNGQTTLNVTMQEDAAELEQVVVIGYGSIRAKDATGAVATVKSDDFNQGIINSPEQLIQGKTAGVQITQTSGEPGAGVNLRIRGTSSVRANNNPLYVVDGFPLSGADTSAGAAGSDIGASSASNPLSFLNPNDIASIDILKDASATAIYGSRGANGVVLITTKQATTGVHLLEFNSSISVSSVNNRLDLLNRDQFLDAQERLGSDISLLDLGGNTDWQDFIYRDGISSEYHAAFGGGNDNGGYRFSVGYVDQEGIIEQTGLERLTARVNGKYNFFDNKLKLNFQLNVSNVDIDKVPISDNANARGDLLSATYYSNPTLSPYDADGNPTSTGSLEQLNPAAILAFSEINTQTLRTLNNLSLEYFFTPELSLKSNIGVDKSISKTENAFSPDFELTGTQGLGRAQVDELTLTSTLWESYLNYNRDFNEDHSINALIGYSYQEFNTKTSALIAADFRLSEPGAMLDNIASAQVFGANTGNFTDELQSFFARVNYSLLNKYLFTGTIRVDGSTRFGPDKKYGRFPSFAAAWRLSEENFIPDIFSDLKLRLGYGVTGNQEIPSNLYVARTRFGLGTIDNGGVFFPGGESIVAFRNDKLQWEESSQINLGLDFGFLNNRLTGSVDLFRKETTDLLLQISGVAPADTNSAWRNIDATVINEGVELTLNYGIIQNEDLQWDTSFNISYLKNEVTDFEEAPINTGQIDGPGLTGAFAQQIADGQPLYAYFLREFIGFDDNGIAQYEGGDVQKFTGDSPLPKYNLGFSNSLKYKNVDLNLFFSGQFGHKIYNNTQNALFSLANLSQGRNATEATAALIGTENPFNSADVSTRFLEKGDFLRLQTATLGYTLNMDNYEWINKVRLFINAQNLFVITDYSGQDPEVSINKQINGVPSLGIDYTAFPKSRTFTFGLNVTF
ncbi:MAG: SusC/RagA family TonB-linked outer membrane protein [Aquimarina sp.]|nr:SusC/RagA family TonB-linked outer membrane protein [Aquimarina sp.]